MSVDGTACGAALPAVSFRGLDHRGGILRVGRVLGLLAAYGLGQRFQRSAVPLRRLPVGLFVKAVVMFSAVGSSI